MALPAPAKSDLARSIGFIGAMGIMLGVIIGSGIFKTPSAIAQHLGSPALILALWVAGGVLSLFGALSYTELAVVFPRSGGLYNFLFHGFGPRVAFIFGWTYTLITKPFAASAIAAIFAEYLNLNAHFGTPWAEPVAVCILLIALTAINARGMRLGAGAGVVLTTIKVLSLGAICLLAATLHKGSVEHFRAGPSPEPFILALSPVMVAILWTYDGWSDVSAVAGEVKDPQRTLPRVYLVGCLIAIALYAAINTAYLYVMPLEQMRESTAVATAVLHTLLGDTGALILAAMVLISTLGSTHASIITGARVTFAQAQDGLFFRFLGRVHPRHGTPHIALWTQWFLSCAAVLWLQNFAKLAGGFVFTMWIFYGLAASAVIVLRIKRPDLHRPYKCVGYPWVPALFVLASAAMTMLSIIDSWKDTLPWLGVLFIGWPAYTLWRRATAPKPSTCIQCGYALAGLPPCLPCPECGAATPDSSATA